MSKSIVPALDWLRTYDRTDLNGDLSAGFIVAIMLIPQGMAYTMLAHAVGAAGKGYVVATNVNLSTWETSGFDINLNYGVGVGEFGSLAFSLVGTLLDKLEFEDIPGLGIYDCVGLWGRTCGDPNPEWRHMFRTTWSTPWNLDLSLAWRHLDKVTVDRAESNPLLSSAYRPINKELDAQSASFHQMRDVVFNAPERLDALTQQLVTVTARIEPSEQKLTELRAPARW